MDVEVSLEAAGDLVVFVLGTLFLTNYRTAVTLNDSLNDAHILPHLTKKVF